MRAALRLGASVALLVLAAGCTNGGPSGVTVTGAVDDTTDTVAVPILAVPTVDVDTGVPDDTDQTSVGAAAGGQASTATDPAAMLGLGASVRVASVKVREGDTVKAGQLVATVDDTTLEAQVDVAKADQAAAKAQVQVLGAAIDETYDKAREIKDAKKKVDDAIAEITSTQQTLVGSEARLTSTRAQLAGKLRAAQQLLAHYPSTPAVPPTTRTPATTPTAPATTPAKPPVTGPALPTKAELHAAIGQLEAAIAKIDAGLRELEHARAQLTTGLATARANRQKLNDAAAEIVDVRAQLRDAKKLAGIASDASAIPVELAQAQVDLTRLSAPVAGVVVSAAQPGDVLAPGASVVEIRADTPSTITVWLSPAQAAQVCLRDAATIRGDWMPAGASGPGSLTRLGTTYEYPPTDVPTDEIHLTRALEAQVSATTEQLPAGVPVDVTIAGCHPAPRTR